MGTISSGTTVALTMNISDILNFLIGKIYCRYRMYTYPTQKVSGIQNEYNLIN